MAKQTFDILALNETRLDNTISDSLIHLPGYNLVSHDRNQSGVGECAYIRNCINFLQDSRDSYTTRLINIIEAYQLMLVIREPTRMTSNTSTLIDLRITNNTESIVHSSVYSIFISDHNLIFASRKISIGGHSPRYVETRMRTRMHFYQT